MALYRNLYARRGVELVADAGWWLIFPSYWLLNALLALYMETTLEATRRVEEKPCYERPLLLAAGTLGLVALVLLSAPLALVGACLWLPAQPFRRPYRYSENVPLVVVSRSQAADGGEPPGDNDGSCSAAAATCDDAGDCRGAAVDCLTVSLLTCNACLLPEGIARFNNLGNVMDRAGKIANLLAAAAATETRRREKGDRGDSAAAAAEESKRKAASVIIRSDVPSGVDVLCLQEVFDRRAASKIRSILSQRFPYILSDVDAFCCGKLLNSGLLFASKFKILDADYSPFAHGGKEDSLAAKGVLMVKVLLDAAATSRLVGYVFSSHLQAHRDQSLVRQAQLDQFKSWTAQFKQRCSQPGDVIALEALCGDFNMDHTSDEHAHSLFDDYVDSCISCYQAAKNTLDSPVDSNGSCGGHAAAAACSSSVGTELIQHRMYDEEIRSPAELMQALLDDGKRPEYLESCCPAGGGRRRIDYVFLRRPQGTGARQPEVHEHALLTAMVTLTDHLPVYTRLVVDRGSPGLEWHV